MSASNPCRNRRGHRPSWRVAQRKVNHSTFSGRRATPSDYSEVVCTTPGCMGRWRTKAQYVDELPDVDDGAPSCATR